MFCDHKEFSNHEMVIACRDEAAGLSALIAIHSTTAGPAMGGCRISAYQTEDEAITDVLRLSRGMTYKNVMAGLPFGGGKAVIVADPHTEKTPQLLRAFATRVDRLGGTFITGEDIGTTVTDIETMRAVTPHVRGIPENGPGDPAQRVDDPSYRRAQIRRFLVGQIAAEQRGDDDLQRESGH